jgi:hypothetical protein
LLNHARFDWVKTFLHSNAWGLILKDRESEATITFSVPQKCPIQKKLVCSEVEHDQEEEPAQPTKSVQGSVIQLSEEQSIPCTPCQQGIIKKSSLTTSDMRLKRKLSKAPLVVKDVRTSERLKEKCNGYKMEACQSRNCFCCNSEPPTLSTRTIRSLGQEFCKIPSKDISDEALQKKALRKKAAVSKVFGLDTSDKKTTKKNDDHPTKKSRKK